MLVEEKERQIQYLLAKIETMVPASPNMFGHSPIHEDEPKIPQPIIRKESWTSLKARMSERMRKDASDGSAESGD